MLALAVGGCANTAAIPTPVVASVREPAPTLTFTLGTLSHRNPIGGHVELVDTLRTAGVTVEPGGAIEQPFFAVPGHMLNVNGSLVQVFEFSNRATREQASSRVTSEGQPDPNIVTEWEDQLYFCAKGQIIVLYVGKDQMVINRLSQVPGDAITIS